MIDPILSFYFIILSYIFEPTSFHVHCKSNQIASLLLVYLPTTELVILAICSMYISLYTYLLRCIIGTVYNKSDRNDLFVAFPRHQIWLNDINLYIRIRMSETNYLDYLCAGLLFS